MSSFNFETNKFNSSIGRKNRRMSKKEFNIRKKRFNKKAYREYRKKEQERRAKDSKKTDHKKVIDKKYTNARRKKMGIYKNNKFNSMSFHDQKNRYGIDYTRGDWDWETDSFIIYECI